MITLLLYYLPSLLGLVLLTTYFSQLWRVARQKSSAAVDIFFQLVLIGVGLIISWCSVLFIALRFLESGKPLLSWEVLFLPIFWGVLLIPINMRIRK